MKPQARLPDWQVRMDQCVRSFEGRVYEWGAFDCCTACADVVESITGVDPMSEIRGAYSSEFGAMRVLSGLGGIGQAWADRIGPEIDPVLAQVGDIGLLGSAVVFCGGSAWFGVSDIGVTPVQSPTVAWRCHV